MAMARVTRRLGRAIAVRCCEDIVRGEQEVVEECWWSRTSYAAANVPSVPDAVLLGLATHSAADTHDARLSRKDGLNLTAPIYPPTVLILVHSQV